MSKKSASRPSHGRLSNDETYLKILALYFAGYSTKGIANHLKLPTQTINRNLSKFRDGLLRKVETLELLDHEAMKSGFLHWGDYRALYQATLGFQSQADLGQQAALRSCVLNCPRAATPAAIQEKFIGFHIVEDFFPHIVTAIFRDDISISEFKTDIALRANCKPCALPGSENIAIKYRDNPDMYADIVQYFCSHRMRGDENFTMHYCMAILISAVKRIADKRYDKCLERKISREIASYFVTRKFESIIRKLYQIHLLPGPSWTQAYWNIL